LYYQIIDERRPTTYGLIEIRCRDSARLSASIHSRFTRTTPDKIGVDANRNIDRIGSYVASIVKWKQIRSDNVLGIIRRNVEILLETLRFGGTRLAVAADRCTIVLGHSKDDWNIGSVVIPGGQNELLCVDDLAVLDRVPSDVCQ
jgi:hypothetical protein